MTDWNAFVDGAQHFHRGNYAKSEEILTRLLLERSDWKDVALVLALAQLRQAKFSNARWGFLRTLCMAPDQPMAWEMYGQCFAHMNLPERGEEMFRRCLSLKSSSVASLRSLGQILVTRGQWDEAERLLRRLVDIEPFNFIGHYLLGMCRASTGDREGAERRLRFAIVGGLSAHHLPYALLGYGRCLAGRGRNGEAIAVLQWSLRFMPELLDAQMALADLDIGGVQSSGDGHPVFLEDVRATAQYVDYRGGREFGRPFRILARIGAHPFGHFIVGTVFAATIKQQFSKSHLTLEWRSGRAYKRDIVSINPHIDDAICCDDDGFAESEAAAGRPNPRGAWDDSWFDLVLHPSMAIDVRLTAFEDSARLAIPTAQVAQLADRLAAMGVRPDRWFCTLHYREPTWEHWLSTPVRDIEPETYRNLAEAIVARLGGQVVRIGHRGMMPFPEIDGFVDLSAESTMMQAFAVSRSRFLVAGPSGPSALGPALHVPTLVTNAVSMSGVWRRADSLLTQHLVTPGGKRVTQARAIRQGMYSTSSMKYLLEQKGYRLVRNNLDEMIAAVSLVSDGNSEIRDWREPGPEPASRPPNQIVWPPPLSRPWRMLEFPELAPRFAVLD
ncbi:MAG: TIGR04372 family glycosyltransferase [Alphaproteobacteria bacterium]|nr:TIGR04372 family glycosyltransferase [Alphaproteobacteria bacterium]